MSDLSSMASPVGQQIAAVDLGSNSFHLIIARWDGEQIHIIDRIKEPVRLGWGLNEHGVLDQAAMDRAMACLERFGERLRGISSSNIRIAGTKTLRSVHRSTEFLREAQAMIGHPVEIISGEEEARIIYLGVAHDLAPKNGNRLVVDIGGGSTEVIIGQGMEPIVKESLSMGCVAMTKRFFGRGKVTSGRLKKARTACMQELVPVLDILLETGWSEEIGASGSIRAVADICQKRGWSDGTVKQKYIDQLINEYLKAKTVDLPMDGLSESRQPVFLGGLVVLSTLFEGLGIKELTAARWALREGLLYDLKGRLEHSNFREVSVMNLAERFHVNFDYAKRVDQTALQLFVQVKERWELKAQDAQLLHWASLLFLVGLDITHSDYHKHGAYIVENVDLPGFSRSEQSELAQLVLAHRKRITKNFPVENEHLLKVLILLRLAIILQRGRRGQAMPAVSLAVDEKELRLELPTFWLDRNPQTYADLQREIRYCHQAGYLVRIVSPEYQLAERI